MSVNKIEIDPHNYEDRMDFDDALYRTIALLGELKYNCSIIYDCEGVAIIQFDHADAELAEFFPVWLTDAEIENLHEITEE
ncbi:MAG: hypothetical protein J6S14_15365 [Clostridia bacterium]|nr:hypothetical protein [Clostridia bacterium]